MRPRAEFRLPRAITWVQRRGRCERERECERARGSGAAAGGSQRSPGQRMLTRPMSVRGGGRTFSQILSNMVCLPAFFFSLFLSVFLSVLVADARQRTSPRAGMLLAPPGASAPPAATVACRLTTRAVVLRRVTATAGCRHTHTPRPRVRDAGGGGGEGVAPGVREQWRVRGSLYPTWPLHLPWRVSPQPATISGREGHGGRGTPWRRRAGTATRALPPQRA
jgi:hypothetical protein